MESGADYADSPRTRRSAWRALPLVALAACGEASTPTPGVDAGVPDPDPVGPGLSVLSEVALSSPAEVAAPLPGGRAVLQAQGDLHLTRTGTTSALAGAVGVLAGAAEWAGTTVVAGRDGVAVLEAGALLPSPLGDALPGFSTRQLLLARPGGAPGCGSRGPTASRCGPTAPCATSTPTPSPRRAAS